MANCQNLKKIRAFEEIKRNVGKSYKVKVNFVFFVNFPAHNKVPNFHLIILSVFPFFRKPKCPKKIFGITTKQIFSTQD